MKQWEKYQKLENSFRTLLIIIVIVKPTQTIVDFQ